MDAGILEEAGGLPQVAEVFVVAQHGEDGRLDAVELLCVVTLDDGAQASVDDVAADEDQIGLFCIDEVHPSRQLCLAVVVSDMEVAGKDNGQRLFQGLTGGEGQFLAILMMIMESTYCYHQREDAKNGEQTWSAVLKKVFRQQVAERCHIGQEKDQEEVEEGYQPRVAHFIEHDGCGHGQTVEGEEPHEHAKHPQ